LALYISIGSIVIRLIWGVSQRITKASSIPTIVLGLIRPFLIVAIVGGFKMRDTSALNSIHNYAEALAVEIQQSYDPNVACPEVLSGWKIEQNNPTYSMCSFRIKRYGRDVAMRYENIKLAGEFRLYVDHFGFGWSDITSGKKTAVEFPPDNKQE